MKDLWPVLNSKTSFKCPWFTVGYDDVSVPNEGTERYYWIDRPEDALGIVAIDDESVVMVEQYRPKLRQTFLECPGGHIEDRETVEEAAARELHEETGISAESYHHLTTYYPTATTRYKRSVVVAENLTEGKPDPDDSEYISWRYVPIPDALSGATKMPTTGWTLTPLLLADNRGYFD